MRRAGHEARTGTGEVHTGFWWENLDQDSVVGIATRYGLDGPGTETRGRERFSEPIQPPIQWVPGLSRGHNCQRVAFTTYPHLVPRLKKEYSDTSTPPLCLGDLF